MKRIIVIVAVIAACIMSDASVAFSQNRTGVVTSSSMIVTRTKIKKEKDPIPIKWQNNIDATVSPQYTQLSYTGGWRFGNFLFLGFGTGIQINYKTLPWDENGILSIKDFNRDDLTMEGHYTPDDFDGYYNAGRIAVPVYLNMKFRFMKTKVAPYLSAAAGVLAHRSYRYELRQDLDLYDPNYGYYSYDENLFEKYGVEGSLFAEIMIGVDFRLKNGSDISIGLGPIWIGERSGANINSYHIDTNASIGGYKLGYSF